MELHFEYYVIEFLHQPYLNVERLVCVPTSWIEANAYGPSDRRVAVAFPAEPLAATIRHVRDKRPPHRAWSWYCALIKFGNDDFNETQRYIMKNNTRQNSKVCKTRGSVVRTSKKSIASKPKKLKDLKVMIRRMPKLEESFKRSVPDISEKKLNMERPTVIKTTKSLSKTLNSNKFLENPNKQPLISSGDNVEKNCEICSLESNTQYRPLDSTNQHNNTCLLTRRNQNKLHLESCTQDIINKIPIEVSSRDQNALVVNIPPSTTNSPSNISPIITSVNGNHTLENIRTEETLLDNVTESTNPSKEINEARETTNNLKNLERNIKYDDLKQLRQNNKMIDLENHQQSTKKNMLNTGSNFTTTEKPFDQISNPFLMKQSQVNFSKDLRGYENFNVESHKEQYISQKPCSQTAQDIIYDLRKMITNYELSTLNMVIPSFTNTQNYPTHTQYNPSTELNQSTQNQPETQVLQKNIFITDDENIYIQKTFNKINAKNDSIDKRPCQQESKKVSNNSNNYAVDDPRKVIIKKVVKVKPMTTKEHFPTTEGVTVMSTALSQTNQIAGEINLIQSPPVYSKSSLHTLRIRDIISAEVEKLRNLDTTANPKITTPINSNISKNDNNNPKQVFAENTTMCSLSNLSNTISVSRNSLLDTKSEEFMESDQHGAPVLENSTLKNLLLQKINYKTQRCNKNDTIQNNCETITLKATNLTEKHPKQSEDNHDKNNDESKYNISTKTNTSIISNIDHTTRETPYNADCIIIDDDDTTMTEDKNRSYIPPNDEITNTKWTLKYPTASLGLVELIPGTQVYINERRLQYCLSKGRDYNILARLLLLEIFTLKALKLCSFSGKPRSIIPRPGLDKGAKLAILKYVKTYGHSKGWKGMDQELVCNSLRNKLHEVRYKYGLVNRRRCGNSQENPTQKNVNIQK